MTTTKNDVFMRLQQLIKKIKKYKKINAIKQKNNTIQKIKKLLCTGKISLWLGIKKWWGGGWNLLGGEVFQLEIFI